MRDSRYNAYRHVPEKGASAVFEPVVPGEIARTHLCHLACASDVFYARVATRLGSEFSRLPLGDDLPDRFIFRAAVTLAAYLEDVVADIGVWPAVRELYRRREGRNLPFFDCEPSDYFDDDINIEDVRLLLWQALMMSAGNDGCVFSPYSDSLSAVADIAFDVLVDEFDRAPDVPRLRRKVADCFRSGDIYEIRKLAVWLYADNPLTCAPSRRLSIMAEAWKLATWENSPITGPEAHFMAEVRRCFDAHISMLGCSTPLLLAQMAGQYGFGNLSADIGQIKTELFGRYRISGCSDGILVLADVAGTEYRCDMKSFSLKSVVGLKSVMVALVRLGDLWYPNGLSTFSKEDVSDMDESKETLVATDEIRDIIRSHGGRRVFYFSTMEEMGIFLGHPLHAEAALPDYKKNIVLLLSDESAPVVLPDYAEVFKDTENPFFKKRESAERSDLSRWIVMGANAADDVAAYIQENDMLPYANLNVSQGKEFGHRIVRENLRFLCGFSRWEDPDIDDDFLELAKASGIYSGDGV